MMGGDGIDTLKVDCISCDAVLDTLHLMRSCYDDDLYAVHPDEDLRSHVMPMIYLMDTALEHHVGSGSCDIGYDPVKIGTESNINKNNTRLLALRHNQQRENDKEMNDGESTQRRYDESRPDNAPYPFQRHRRIARKMMDKRYSSKIRRLRELCPRFFFSSQLKTEYPSSNSMRERP